MIVLAVSQASAEDVEIAQKAVKKALTAVGKPGAPGLVFLTAAPPARAVPEWRLLNLVTGLRKEKKLIGLAAMVMVDGKFVVSAAI